MRGRGPGPGRIEKTGSGYNGIWSDASGRRHRRLLGRTRDDAQRALNKIVRDRDLENAGLLSEAQQERPLDDVLDLYLKEISTFRRPLYIRSLNLSFKRLRDFLGPVRVRNLTVQRVLEYRRQRLAGGASNRMANIETMALKTALKWAVGAGLVHVNPLAQLKPLPSDESTQRRRRRALSEDEITKFIEAAVAVDAKRASYFAAEKTIASGIRGAAYARRERRPPIPQSTLWKTLVLTGIRWNEACTLQWADLDETAGLLRVRSEIAKGKRHRVVPVPKDLMTEIIGLRRAHVRRTGKLPSPGDNVFLTAKGKIWKQSANGPAGRLLRVVLAAAGIPEVDALGRQVDVHSLRVTCCTRLLRKDVPVNIVAKVLGHKDVRVTMKHYSDLNDADIVRAVGEAQRVGAAHAKRDSRISERMVNG
jgi:integrase